VRFVRSDIFQIFITGTTVHLLEIPGKAGVAHIAFQSQFLHRQLFLGMAVYVFQDVIKK
jgi:hypothetical protein